MPVYTSRTEAYLRLMFEWQYVHNMIILWSQDFHKVLFIVLFFIKMPALASMLRNTSLFGWLDSVMDLWWFPQQNDLKFLVLWNKILPRDHCWEDEIFFLWAWWNIEYTTRLQLKIPSLFQVNHVWFVNTYYAGVYCHPTLLLDHQPAYVLSLSFRFIYANSF